VIAWPGGAPAQIRAVPFGRMPVDSVEHGLLVKIDAGFPIFADCQVQVAVQALTLPSGNNPAQRKAFSAETIFPECHPLRTRQIGLGAVIFQHSKMHGIQLLVGRYAKAACNRGNLLIHIAWLIGIFQLVYFVEKLPGFWGIRSE